jgi:hypothetical protein
MLSFERVMIFLEWRIGMIVGAGMRWVICRDKRGSSSRD